MRDWKDVLPGRVAYEQAANERARRVYRARCAGATFAEIARKVGLSPSRVAQLAAKGARHVRYAEKRGPRAYPIQSWLNEGSLLSDKEKAMLRAVEVCTRDWLRVSSQTTKGDSNGRPKESPQS